MGQHQSNHSLSESSLTSGVTAVLTEGRSTIHHQLMLSQQAKEPGQVLWVDARDTASTYVLHDLADDPSLLDGITIARAWTAYQHHALVTHLVSHITPRTRLLVLPNVCSLYRDDDVRDPMAAKLLVATLSTLSELATAASLPVLLTANSREESTVQSYATTIWSVQEATRKSATLSTIDPTSTWVQTTIPHWVEKADELLAFTDRCISNPVQQRLAVGVHSFRCD